MLAPSFGRSKPASCNAPTLDRGMPSIHSVVRTSRPGPVPVDLWRPKVRVAGRIVAELGRSGGLQAQIHLQAHAARQRFDDLDQAQATGFRRRTLGEAGSEHHVVEVAPEPDFDARTQDLDRDRTTAFRFRQSRAMNLGDRGGGDGRPELRESVGKRLPQRALDGRDSLGLRERLHAILKRLEAAGGRKPDDIGPCRQELAELDVGRPKPRHGARQRAGATVGLSSRQLARQKKTSAGPQAEPAQDRRREIRLPARV